MEILNEEQQLKKRKDDLYDLWGFAKTEIDRFEDKISKKEDRWFANKGNLRLLKYYKKQYTAVADAIGEYYSEITSRLEEIQKPKQ